jgi:hypothetical protein
MMTSSSLADLPPFFEFGNSLFDVFERFAVSGYQRDLNEGGQLNFELCAFIKGIWHP